MFVSTECNADSPERIDLIPYSMSPQSDIQHLVVVVVVVVVVCHVLVIHHLSRPAF